MLLKPSVHLTHPDIDSQSQEVLQPRPIKTTADKQSLAEKLDNHLAQSDDYVLIDEKAAVTEVKNDSQPRELMQDYNEDLASWLAAFNPIPNNYVLRKNKGKYLKNNASSHTKFWKRKRNLPPNWQPRILKDCFHPTAVKHTAFTGDWMTQRPLLSRAEVAYHLKRHYQAGNRLRLKKPVDIKSTARYARYKADKDWKKAEIVKVHNHYYLSANDNCLRLDPVQAEDREKLSLWFARQEQGKQINRPFEILKKVGQFEATRLYRWFENKEKLNPSHTNERTLRADKHLFSKRFPKLINWGQYWSEKFSGQYGLDKWLKAREPINKGLYGHRFKHPTAIHVLTLERAKAAYSLAVRHYLNGRRSEEQLKATYKFLFKRFPEFYPRQWPVLVGEGKLFKNSFASIRLVRKNQAFLSGEKSNKEILLLEHKPVITPWKFVPNPAAVKDTPKPQREDADVITKSESEFSRSVREKIFYEDEIRHLIHYEIDKARKQFMMEWTLSGPEIVDQIAGQVTRAVKENLACPTGYLKAANGLYIPERISA